MRAQVGSAAARDRHSKGAPQHSSTAVVASPDFALPVVAYSRRRPCGRAGVACFQGRRMLLESGQRKQPASRETTAIIIKTFSV